MAERTRLRWARRDVPAPADRVWDLPTDTTWWPRRGPSLTAIEPPDAVVEPLLTGRVCTPIGVWLPFEIDDVAPGRSWGWTVAGGRATHHAVDPVDTACCRVGIGAPRPARGHPAGCRVALDRRDRRARLAEDERATGPGPTP